MPNPIVPPWARGTVLAVCALVLLLAGCTSLQPAPAREPSWAIAPDNDSALARRFAADTVERLGHSGFKVLASGRAALAVRLELADAAELTLDLQYYSASDGASTDRLLLRLLAAAERGVRVRLLLDDIYASSRRFARRVASAHPRIQARLFNPFRFGGSTTVGRLAELALDGVRLNRRMHNKLWITDNAVAVLGSRNLGDEYFDVASAANFNDVELLTVGPVVADLSSSFDAYWNSSSVVPIEALEPAGEEHASAGERSAAHPSGNPDAAEAAAPNEPQLLGALRGGKATLAWAEARFDWDAPDLDKRAPASGIEHGSIDDHPGGTRTRHELLIVSPYFVPSADGRRHLAEMRERGVRVAILTNSLASTDSPAAHAGYARHRPELLSGGIELFELRPSPGVAHQPWHRWGRATASGLHAKVIVQDRTRSIVGSFNQDPRSRLHNTEAWVTIDSRELAGELVALFDESVTPDHAFELFIETDTAAAVAPRLRWRTEEDGRVVHHDSEPMAGSWLRLWRATLGLLIPEHLL